MTGEWNGRIGARTKGRGVADSRTEYDYPLDWELSGLAYCAFLHSIIDVDQANEISCFLPEYSQYVRFQLPSHRPYLCI